MQEVWAKVLAGESNQRSSFSKRAIDCLMLMSREEAIALTNLCQFIWLIGGHPIAVILDQKSPLYTKNNASYGDMLRLEAAGLITLGTGFTRTFLSDSGILFEYFDRLIVAMRRPPPIAIPVGYITMTPVARELISILDVEPVEGHFEFAIEYWYRHGFTFASPISRTLAPVLATISN